MAGETEIHVVGNMTSDAELRYTQSGLAVANFTIASTPRTFDKDSNQWKDGEALFLRCSVWREFAEHVAQYLQKGTRVVAIGNLKQRSYETKEGEKRTSFELDVTSIGPDLQWATAQVHRQQSNSNQQQRGQQRQQQQGRDQGQVQGGGQQQQQQQQGGQQQGPYGQEPWGQQQGGQQQGGGQGAGGGDVWNTPGGGTYNDETPF